MRRGRAWRTRALFASARAGKWPTRALYITVEITIRFFLIIVAVRHSIINITNTGYNNATCIISFACSVITFGLTEDRVGDLVVCSLRPPSMSILSLIFSYLPLGSYVLLISQKEGTALLIGIHNSKL